MSERMRRHSSKWDQKKKPELTRQRNHDIFPAKRDNFVTNESKRAWNLQQVDCDNVGQHDKILKETSGSSFLDAPHLPWDEHESYSTRMSPGLDDWRRQNNKLSPKSGWYNSSYRNANKKQRRSPPCGFNQDKRLDGRRTTSQSHNLLSVRDTRSEFPLDIAKKDTKFLKTSRYPITDREKAESSDIRNGNSRTEVASAQERPRKVSRQREIGRDMDAFLFEQQRELKEPYHSDDLPCRYISEDNCVNRKYSRLSHANPTIRSQNDERRNLTMNKFEIYTNQNLETGFISNDINEREEQPNWTIDKRIPGETTESWLEGMEISSPWNPRESSILQDPNNAITGEVHKSCNALPRQTIQNDRVVSNPSTLNFTIENQQMVQSTHILPVIGMNKAQEKELREVMKATTTRFDRPPIEGKILRASSEVSLTQQNHSQLVTFSSPSLAQLTRDIQQLSQPYTVLNFSKSLESILSSTNDSMVKCNSEVQIDKDGEKLECLNLIAVDCSSMGKINDTNDPETKENKIGEEASLLPENGNDEKKTRDDNKKGILRAFKFALAEFVKEILKPRWKDSAISKDSYKAIVKKVVDKVMSSIPQARIPRSHEKITNYLSSSESKLAKLVEAYVDKHHKKA